MNDITPEAEANLRDIAIERASTAATGGREESRYDYGIRRDAEYVRDYVNPAARVIESAINSALIPDYSLDREAESDLRDIAVESEDDARNQAALDAVSDPLHDPDAVAREAAFGKYRNPDPRCAYPFSADILGYCWGYANKVDRGAAFQSLDCANCDMWEVLSDDRAMPDTDAAEQRVELQRDGEAEACTTCGGTGTTYINYDVKQPCICPTCHGEGRV